MLMKARKFMMEAHQNQFRWDGVTPYHTHPDQVVSILSSWKIKDSSILTAGYLHDTVEDTNVTFDDILNKFGLKVALIVDILTFPKDITDDEYFKKCKAMPDEAKLIKIADILSNITDVSSKKSKHFIEKRLKALSILTENVKFD